MVEQLNHKCIVIESVDLPSLDALCTEIVRILQLDVTTDSGHEFRDIGDPENPQRNSLVVFQLIVSKEASLHVKVIHAPDAESEYFEVVTKRFPTLAHDPNLLLPVIIPVLTVGEQCPRYYVHVTPWIQHDRTLTQLLISDWMSGRYDQVATCLESFGGFLRGFHNCYSGLHHTDMNPSNVLISKNSHGILRFILADCAGLDDQVGDDCRTFIESLKVLAYGGFGDEFFNLASTAFNKGYNEP